MNPDLGGLLESYVSEHILAYLGSLPKLEDTFDGILLSVSHRMINSQEQVFRRAVTILVAKGKIRPISIGDNEGYRLMEHKTDRGGVYGTCI